MSDDLRRIRIAPPPGHAVEKAESAVVGMVRSAPLAYTLHHILRTAVSATENIRHDTIERVKDLERPLWTPDDRVRELEGRISEAVDVLQTHSVQHTARARAILIGERR